VEDLANDDDENQETKIMIHAFLTRDDRNTFIGTFALARMILWGNTDQKTMCWNAPLKTRVQRFGGDQSLPSGLMLFWHMCIVVSYHTRR
jgi:hypothetical protein